MERDRTCIRGLQDHRLLSMESLTRLASTLSHSIRVPHILHVRVSGIVDRRKLLFDADVYYKFFSILSLTSGCWLDYLMDRIRSLTSSERLPQTHKDKKEQGFHSKSFNVC